MVSPIAGAALVLTLLTAVTAATMLPPRLTPVAAELRVTEGQSGVVLQCNLDVGDDPVEYRWIKNHLWVTGSLGHAYRGYRSVFLGLHPIRREHAGRYVCQAFNEAGSHTAFITVIVEPDPAASQREAGKPQPIDEVLAEMSASLSDVLAESGCKCDAMFLLHASQHATGDLVSVQANLINTIAENIISEEIRVSVMTYSDYIGMKLPFGNGTNSCALRKALSELNHQMWATKIPSVMREVFKKFRKSTSPCKILFLPIMGSAGSDGIDIIGSQNLMKMGVKVFVLEVTDEAIPDLEQMSSKRGDGKPYHWRVPLPIWPSIVTYMQYITEELSACSNGEQDVPGVCVGVDGPCDNSDQCRGAGMGCILGTCLSLECNVDPTRPGCCSTAGRFWCGDVTRNCTSSQSFCDGRVHCMNGRDENTCWTRPCPDNRVAQCESTTLCLSLSELCDGHHHCPAGEDEEEAFCKRFPCPSDRQFRCRSGKCISNDKLCDGKFMDCEEGEDENLEYCYRTHHCGASRSFKCDYGVCIESSVVCDGTYNCLDGTDEKHCKVTTCPVSRPFKCSNGECVKIDTACNGLRDGCNDGSDEHNCANFTCPVERSFKCLNGRCIDSWLQCNRGDDCGDGSDETEDCQYQASYRTTLKPSPPLVSSTGRPPVMTVCAPDQFKCRSGACIAEDRVCDGRSNCIDGDDEVQCSERECPPSRPYRCTTSQSCVNAIVCDGIADCPDGTDENECVIVDNSEDTIIEDDSGDEHVSTDEYNYEEYDYDELVENHGMGSDDNPSDNEIDVGPHAEHEPEPETFPEPEISPEPETEPEPQHPDDTHRHHHNRDDMADLDESMEETLLEDGKAAATSENSAGHRINMSGSVLMCLLTASVIFSTKWCQ